MEKWRAERQIERESERREGETLCNVDVFRFRERNSLTSSGGGERAGRRGGGGETALRETTLRRNENDDGGQERKQLNARARVVALFRRSAGSAIRGSPPHRGAEGRGGGVIQRAPGEIVRALARDATVLTPGPGFGKPQSLLDRYAAAASYGEGSPARPPGSLHARD